MDVIWLNLKLVDYPIIHLTAVPDELAQTFDQVKAQYALTVFGKKHNVKQQSVFRMRSGAIDCFHTSLSYIGAINETNF